MTTLDKIVSLAKRRGFVFPTSEIYGGFSGFYDFGHLGNELKFNIKQSWWREVVQKRENVVGLSSATIFNPKTWKASGHVEGFTDPLESGERFNTMFKTSVGVGDEAVDSYLRPETAQGIFTNFKSFIDTFRLKPPFGIAQIGRAYRNEISPRNFIFRTREFEQMELEYFVHPKEADKAFKEWVKDRLNWYGSIGLKNVKSREQSEEERAHYSKKTIDIEYKFPFGMGEIEGIANRGDFDLKAHGLDYYDEEVKERYVPYVIEPSAGVERIFLALLCEVYTEEKDRAVLKFHPTLAPYKAAVFPLLANKPKLVKLAKSIYDDLKKDLVVAWDDRGNIGKRYYSQDEIGTPYCITVDFDSLEKKDVTVRNRDTTKQKRVKSGELPDYLKEKLK
jgi:glycyl-tRNA synthetase